jgi:hypothetical protein
MNLEDVTNLLDSLDCPSYEGYAPTGARVPYVVARPQIMDHEELVAITGDAVAWNNEMYLYACGGSVSASYNLAVQVMGILQGARLEGSTLDTTMGYAGASVEGHYESQITVQKHQGGL